MDQTLVRITMDDVEIYTHVQLKDKKWVWYQELKVNLCWQTAGPLLLRMLHPWLVLRFNSFDGEMYGRGRVEQFIGDLKSLEGLCHKLSSKGAQQLLR